MPLHPDAAALIGLQELELAARGLERQLDGLPHKRDALEAEVEDSQAALDARRSELKQAEVQRKQVDLELHAAEEALARYQAQQLQTRKNDEYQALANEIEHTRKKISQLEDQELALMLQMDEMQTGLPPLEQALAAAQSRRAQSLEALAAQEASLEEKLADLKKQIAAATAQVDPDALARYRRILGSKKDVAIVPLENEICQGCHMKLTHATALQAGAGTALTACDNCGRLVYVR